MLQAIRCDTTLLFSLKKIGHNALILWRMTNFYLFGLGPATKWPLPKLSAEKCDRKTSHLYHVCEVAFLLDFAFAVAANLCFGLLL